MSNAIWVIVAIAMILVVAAVAVLLFFSQGQGTGTQSVSINGTRYWALSVPLTENLTSLQFMAVTFNFSYPCDHAAPPPPGGGVGQGCANVTFTAIQCPNGNYQGAQICQGTLPQIHVVYPDGTNEYFNEATTINGVITYDSQKTPNRVWFTVVSNQKVGIEWVTDHPPPNTLVLLVPENFAITVAAGTKSS